MNLKQSWLFLPLLVLCGCQPAPPAAESATAMQHDIGGSATPWTSQDFDAGDGKFTFAVHSDLTGGERERVFEVAVEQLRLLRPEFVIGVGDLIEGGTDDRAQLAKEWDWFDERAGRLQARLFRVGGNHDLTNPVMNDVWEERYARRYYHFVYKNALFLVINSEDMTDERMLEINTLRNEAMAAVREFGWDAYGDSEYAKIPENKSGHVSAEQAAYFADVIAAHPDVRWTFLFTHKAPWLAEAPNNFATIESALAGRRYTVFHGHVHGYQHQERNGNDYIRLATTGGVQFTDRGLSADHVTLVTVSETGVDIATLLMSGILDKTGNIPLNGNDMCFNLAECGEQATSPE